MQVVYLWQRLDALSSHLDDSLRRAGGRGADIFYDQSCGGHLGTLSFSIGDSH